MDWTSGFDVPSMDTGFDWAGALRTAGSAVGSIVSTAGQLYTTAQTLKTQREVSAVNALRSRLATDVEMVRAAGAVDIAKAQVAGEVAKQRAAAAGYTVVSGAGGGLSLGVVALIVGGLLLARKYL